MESGVKFKKIIVRHIVYLFFILLMCKNSFASILDSIMCPVCGENTVVVLDDEYGVCACESCDELFIIVNGKVKLQNGRKINLSDIFDIDKLIAEIEAEYNGKNDDDISDESEEEEESESYYEIIYDDNEKKEISNSGSDDGDELHSSGYVTTYKNAWEEVKYLYNKDFTTYEPETDEEIYQMIIDKKYKKSKKATKKTATESDLVEISTISNTNKNTKNISSVMHVIRYHDGYSDNVYKDIIFNSVEFNVRDEMKREGYKFVCWATGKSRNIRVYPGNPLIFYNFDKEGNPKAMIYDFYAIWEKDV